MMHSSSNGNSNQPKVTPAIITRSAPDLLQRNNHPGTSSVSDSPRRIGVAAIPNTNILFLSRNSNDRT
jgi:hypothetical protein